MKRALWSVSTVFLLLAASAVFAQNGTICLYADPQGTQCNLTDTAPGVLSVYVIANAPDGAIGAVFAAPKPSCMAGASWITDSAPYRASLSEGNSQDGAVVTFGGCLSEPTHILTIQYSVSGTSQTDCPYSVVRALDWGFIELDDCSGSLFGGTGGTTYVNSASSCQCSEPSGPPELFVTPSSLSFASNEGHHDLWMENRGGGTMPWSISSDQTWLRVRDSTGNNDAKIWVWVTRSGLTDGTYTGHLTVSGAGNNVVVPVTMAVPSAPVLAVEPTALTFNTTGQPKEFWISNSGAGTLEWTISADRPWISITPPLSGTGNKWVSVRVAPPGPSAGAQGHVTVQSNGGTSEVLIRYEPGLSDAGVIGVFSDVQATNCNVNDRAPGVITLYVVHVLTAGATASQFGAPVPSCMTGAVYLGETTPFPVVLGNTQGHDGVVIGYGGCRSGTIHLLTLVIMGQGTSQNCCEFPVVAAPSLPSGRIEVPDCNYEMTYAAGAAAVVNPTPACACGSVRAEDMTWGHIKAIYSPEE